jgi:ring-1,2-phenylacetyl-CoA epoxidase subunit PaaE
MATPQFHPLRIREVRPETADSVSVAFEVPVELRDHYRFTQGQFVTLKTHIDGEETRRSYSICVGVTDYDRDGELRIGIKRVRGGRFSNFAFDTLQPGHTIDVMTPDGRFFTHLNADQGQQYIAFSGGSGITPVLAIIKTTLEVEPRSTFTLVYGNRSVDQIMFAEELEDLKNRFMNRFVLYHVLSDDLQDVELFNGVLDQQKCAAFIENLLPADAIDEAFVCGPAPMMDAAEAALKAAGVPSAKVHVERFGSPLPQAGVPPVEITDDTPAADLEIVLDGKKAQAAPAVSGRERARRRLACRPCAAVCVQGRRLLHLPREGARRRGEDGKELHPGRTRNPRRFCADLPMPSDQRSRGGKLRRALSRTRRVVMRHP